jgi:hypothetical protein
MAHDSLASPLSHPREVEQLLGRIYQKWSIGIEGIMPVSARNYMTLRWGSVTLQQALARMDTLSPSSKSVLGEMLRDTGFLQGLFSLDAATGSDLNLERASRLLSDHHSTIDRVDCYWQRLARTLFEDTR